MRTRPVLAAVLAVGAVAVLASVAGPPSASAAAPDDRIECPRELDCRFVPAAEGRYASADRPRDMDVRYIVIHDTELTYDDTIKLFTKPGGGSAAHYLLRSSDGAVTQFLRNSDVGYHAGNFWFNMHSIGIEHEGFAAEGARWYTDAMYEASARLVRHLAQRYDIPLDREHILGHDEISPAVAARTRNMHWDPGPYWDWARYFDLLGAPLEPSPPAQEPTLTRPAVVMLLPRFADNTVPLRQCGQSTCTDLPPQGTSTVYLRSAPSAKAPLIVDPVLRPDLTPGTTALSDISARASTGQRFAVAGRVGEWTGIWFAGQIGWFADAGGRIGAPDSAALVTPRRGSIPVYGAAFPEQTAYPDGITPTAIEPLPWTIPAGQFYVAFAEHRGDEYSAPDDGSGPRVHIVGQRRLVEISFNHRRAFLDLEDVVVR